MFAKVEIPYCGTASGVAFRAGGFENSLDFRNDGRILCSKGGSKPALDSGGRDVLHTFFKNGSDARVPHFGSANFRGSAAKDELVQTLRGIRREPHTDLAAHGESAEVKAFELLGIGEGENIFGELLDGVWARRDGRFAMTAGV